MLERIILAIDENDTQEALQLLAELPNIMIDNLGPFGYPALTHAVMANNQAVAMAILDKGPDVNRIDKMGRTPLYWATEANLTALMSAFIERGGDPNHLDGGRLPMMAYSLLRKDTEQQNILMKRGAKESVAKDVINCKMLGHRYELPGFGFIYGSDGKYIDVSFEGFIPEFSLHVLSQSLNQFSNHSDAQPYKSALPYIRQTADALMRGYRLRQYTHHTHQHINHMSRIRGLLDHDLIILPITYSGHAITMAFHGNLFAKCDRGAQSKIEEPIGVHEVSRTQNQNHGYYCHLLYDRHDKYLHFEVYKQLGLKHVVNLPTHSQIVGNCSWANTEASVLACVFMLMHEANPENSQDNYEQSLAVYHAWQSWDKDIALTVACSTYLEADKKRQKAMASVLVSILALRLYPENPADITRAKQIVKTLDGTAGEAVLLNTVKNLVHSDPEGQKYATLLNKIGYLKK